MKKFLFVIFSIAGFLLHAESEVVGKYTWGYSVSGGQSLYEQWASITGVAPKSGDIVIPSTIGGRPVRTVASGAFESGVDINSIVVPDGVAQIDQYAFAGCSTMTNIILPASVASIGPCAFLSCPSIGNATLPSCGTIYESSSYAINAYVKDVFPSSTVVTNLVIADGSKRIAANCFYAWTSLRTLQIPNTVTNIGSGAFGSCYKLKSIKIPASVTGMDANAFAHCVNLTEVIFEGDAPTVHPILFENSNDDMIVRVPKGSKGWDGNPDSEALPKRWPSNTSCGRPILHIGEVLPGTEPTVITNYVYTTVTNHIHYHHEVTNVVEHYTTVTNVVRYVPEPGTSPAPAYHINAGASGDLQIAGAAGWDAYGVPDGMTWDQKNGVLSGAANKSGVYDLLLVSGSGTETKIMRTTLEVKGYAAIVGHVGVAFSKSGAPVNCLKSYKTLPAGLKWDAKSKVLSGIPTKAQTLSYETVYGDPVTIEIKPAETTMAGTYNGMIGYRVEEGEGDSWHAIGNLTLTAAATGKLSAKVVVPQGTYSFSASAWDSVSDGIYRVDLSTKAGDTLCIVLDTTKDWMEDRLIVPSSFKIAKDENSYVAAGWRNEHGKTDAIAKDPVASEFISRIKALKKMYLKATKVDDDHYTLEAQTAAKGADVTLTFNANGTVAYSGKVGSTKVSGTSTLAVDGDSYYTIFDLVVPVSKTRAMHFAMGFDKGPSSTPIPDFEVGESDIL